MPDKIAPQRFHALTAKYRQLRIAVVGDFCLDRYLEIDPARAGISIETGLTVHNIVRVRSQPGGAGTILNNLAALGIGEIFPVGFAGEDGEGFELRRALASVPGVKMDSFITTPGRRTFTYTKPLIVSPPEPPRELNRLDFLNWTPTSLKLQKRLAGSVRTLAPKVDAIIILDQVDVPETGVVTRMLLKTIAGIKKKHPKLLMIADSRQRLGDFPPVSLKMNRAELSKLASRPKLVPIRDVPKTASALAAEKGSCCFVTMADQGIIAAEPGGIVEHVPALPMRGEIDVVGAGDCVTANLATRSRFWRNVARSAANRECSRFGCPPQTRHNRGGVNSGNSEAAKSAQFSVVRTTTRSSQKVTKDTKGQTAPDRHFVPASLTSFPSVKTRPFASTPAGWIPKLAALGQDAPLTPMMAQYRRIKGELPREALLLFRLGDFYEMFFDDAKVGAQLLNVALTKRGEIPMCGIPFHAANGYIARILKAGRKVAICDQVEEARPGQLVKREVTQILSPGTHFDERLLTAERNNFLAALYAIGDVVGLALADLTTGDFKTTELHGEAALRTELERLRPAEIIYPSASENLAAIARHEKVVLNAYEDWVFGPETAEFTVREHFKVASLDGFGLKGRPAAVGAAGAVLHYLTQHLRRDASALTRLSFYLCSDFMALDIISLKNLEILEPLHAGSPRDACLYGALNRTVTPMGARRLRDWLSQPLASQTPITRRREAVRQWLENGTDLENFRQNLGEVRDLERMLGRLSAGSGNGRDLLALRIALERIPILKGILAQLRAPRTPTEFSIISEPVAELGLLVELDSQLMEAPDLVELFSRAIVDEPPLALKEGGIIRDGFDANLDELRSAMRDGKNWIAQLQQDEMARTGISSLKVRFNSVFGYYIEVTKSNLDKVPPDYIRKQTVANGERFITPALKEMEGKILGAEERSVKLEYELFQRVREQALEQLPRLQQSAAALAQLDVLAAFAQTARLHNYCQPEVAADGLIDIRDGRHPVLEQMLAGERFVPNDAALSHFERQLMLITGPNMAGKSTFIRQVALITLMAHTGSFVPAAAARIGLVDRIFTRIGASDDLARGQSTFMVEMTETANILNNATARSLVILDEIGRGTSTFDGLSLAWSIVEHLHNVVGAKTLFATHYHELTELAARLPRVKNLNVAVREWNDQIVFLRKIVEGATDKSYGIQVARLAGVPKSVITRAREILSNLEESELTPEGKVRQVRRRPELEKLKKLGPPPQLDLFG